jgi:hypothetical protein
MYKVRIKKLPTAQQGRSIKTGQQSSDGALSIQPTAMGGADIDQYMGKKPTEVKDTISRVPRNEANLEAEGGETAYGDINGDGFAEHYKITGPRHSSGGVPLNLPDDTFIFSDTRSMRLNDPALLAKFGKTKGSYTPAELAKQYDLNKYRKILQDPDSDEIAKKTAEMMIRNYNMKLGALALAQESKKGFPQGIPLVARPYMEANGITDEDLMPTYQPRFTGQGETEDAEFEEMPMNGTAPEQPSMEQNTVPGYQGPNPEDIAMTEEMMQSAPMAQYGMSVGDYSMPFAQEGIVINPYEQAKTSSGNLTPTGQSNKFSARQQALSDYLASWESLIPGISKMNEGDAQSAMYDWTLENNPDEIRRMWKEYGLTAKGMKSKDLKKLSDQGKFTDEKLKDTEVLSKLKDAYVDNLFGIRQLAPTVPEKTTEEEIKKEPKVKVSTTCKCTDKDGKSYDPGKDANGKCNECKPTERPEFEDVEIGPETGAVVPDWTTPDLMNYYGALKDKYSLNKYYPWAAPVDMEEMRSVYLDPTRDIAAQSEQANIMTNALAQFTGPQALSSRASQVQGTSAKQAADTLSRYNNANVQLANQFGANNAQIRNQERAANQGIAKQLYDQTTLTNATFDRDKRLADNVTRQAFATGWKNASDIAMLNATSPQYEIDPRTGTVVFERGKELRPEVNTTFDNLLQGYIRQGFSPKDAIAAAKSAMGQSSGYGGPDVETIMANAKDGGMYVMGSNVFPFMFY